jgi:hypothetical protein
MRVVKLGAIAFADVSRMRVSVRIVRELHRTNDTRQLFVVPYRELLMPCYGRHGRQLMVVNKKLDVARQ